MLKKALVCGNGYGHAPAFFYLSTGWRSLWRIGRTVWTVMPDYWLNNACQPNTNVEITGDTVAYQAKVLPVMIASPGDVFEERETVREVLHTWNYINSLRTGLVLMPAGWETHSSPELGNRPQELINGRVLKDCDLLIGVFWTRIGSPTGTSESGTVEEIEEHTKAGKPAMLYFSSRPVTPDSVDPAQYQSLQAFKAKCKALGLIETFDNIIDFRDKLSRQLQLCLHNNSYLRSLLANSGGNAPPFVEDNANGIRRPDLGSQLTVEARVLLKTASRDKNGTILKLAMIGGRFIQAGGKSFGGGGGRESARWEHALNELLGEGLVVERGHKGEYFELTHEGWALADKLSDDSDL